MTKGMRVSTNLRKAMRNAKLSKVATAKAIGCTRLTIYNWLAGKAVSPAYQGKVTRFLNQHCE